MNKRLSLIFLLLLSVACGFAQLNKANSYFNNYEYSKAIPLYTKLVKHDSTNIQALQRLADCYRLLKEYPQAELVYQKVVRQKGIDPLNYFYYGLVLKNNNKINLAKDQFVKYSELVPSDKTTNVSIKSCEDIKIWITRPPRFEVRNVKEINTKASEFCPVYYKNKIVFTAERRKDMVNFEMSNLNSQPFLDVYYTVPTEEKGKVNYSKPRLFPGPVNSDYHDGPVSVDKNSNLYITRVYNYSKGADFINRPKILIALVQKNNKPEKNWEKVIEFPFNSDDFAVEHPCISPDGDELYFTSTMPGGFGGSDIWVSRKKGDKWQKPENLGPDINTSGNEAFPSLRKDGTLYFSSDGQPGFGGLDIFSAIVENNKWTNVSNLGLPLNSSTDDFGIAFSEDMQKGYFSSDRPGGVGSDDIYSFNVSTKAIDVSGKVLLSQQLNDPAKNVKLFLMTEDGTIVNFTTSDSLGFFKFDNLSPELKYLVKMDENDPLLRARKKLYMADNENKIIRVTVVNEKGDKFIFQSLPADKNALPMLDENDSGLPTLAGSIMYGDNALPMANAKINLVDEAGEVVKSTITNSVGAFVFTDLSDDKKYLVKLAENDYLLPPNTKIVVLDKKGDIIFSTVTTSKGFNFQLLPADQTKLSMSEEGGGALKANMAGRLISGNGTKTPLANVKVNLVNDKGEVVETVYTDADGNFKFSELPSDKNLFIRLNDDDPKLANIEKVLLVTEKGKAVGEINNEKQGSFHFELLPADQAKLKLSEEEDVKLKMSMSGKLLSGIGANKPLTNVKVDLVNDKGEVVETVYTDADGNFKFNQLPSEKNFLVRVDENDPKLAKLPRILLADDKGKVVGEMNNEKRNGFRFEYLASDKASLSLMSVDDSQLKFSMKGKILNGDGNAKPIANTKVNLINDKGEIVQTGYTDDDGNFVFSKLPSDQNFYVSVDEKDSKLLNIKRLTLKDETGNTVKEIRLDAKGKFKFQLLASDTKTLSLMQVEDSKLRSDLLGKLMLTDGSDKGLANKKVSLVNEKGVVVDSTTTDENGQFAFKNLPSDQKYLVKLSEEDAGMSGKLKLVLTDEKGNNKQEISSTEDGIFQYQLLTSEQRIFTFSDENGTNRRLNLKGRFLAGDSLKTESLANSKVDLYSDKDELLKSTFTDKFGRFSFSDLPTNQKFIIKMDEHDPKLISATKLILADEKGVTVKELKSKKGRYRFELLPTEVKALSTVVDDDSFGRLKFMERKLFANGKKPDLVTAKKTTKVIAKPIDKDLLDLPKGSGQFENIYFERNGSTLSPEAKAVLMKIVQYMKATPRAVVEIDGFADSRAGQRYNLFLSSRRTIEVKNFLISHGANVNYLKAVAYGKTHFVNNCTENVPCEEGQHAQNRRVEFKVTIYHYKSTK